MIRAARLLPWPVMLCMLFLGITAGYPLLLLFLQSLFPELLGGSLDGFLSAYRAIGDTPEIGTLLWNSLSWAGAVTLASWVFGIPCGYLLARTHMAGKGWARLSLLMPIMTPPYIAALSYILVMQDGGFADSLLGTMPEALRAAFFSFWGVTLVMALSSFGYVALAVEATLSGLPRRLEDAALQLGASRTRVAVRIMLPLLLPAVINSGLLVFLESLSNFGVPAVLGTRANLPLLPAEIFYLVTSWPVDLALATSLSSLLCLFALAALYGGRWIAALFSAGGSRPGQHPLRPLARQGQWLAWGWFGGLFLLSTGLPYAAMLLTSIADRWQDGLPSLTLSHYGNLLAPGSRGLSALLTSLWLSIAAASVCVAVGGYIAYVSARSEGRARQVMDGLAMLPRVIPKIVMAVALILAWNAPWIPVNVYNTVWMLLLAYVAIYITDALNYANAQLAGIGSNLERAAALMGASRWTIFVRIVLPQLKPALLAAWLTTFIVCMRELVASILLLPPGVDTSATFIFNQFEQGDIGLAMAMATLTIMLSMAVMAVVQRRRHH
ncbi:ABC transporter permease [Isoalcanivorax indicus]|uniref:ABC transporter permease n=1 Tax=Isoalcanivorax indicus TaxID=2202653 RepID=UPI000DBAA630|nr:iron ABC transporter permease [Isoalcanivorax indicus]